MEESKFKEPFRITELILKCDFREQENKAHFEALLTIPRHSLINQEVVLDFEPRDPIESVFLKHDQETSLHYDTDGDIQEYFSQFFNTSRDLHSLDAQQRALATLRKKGSLRIMVPSSLVSESKQLVIGIRYTVSNLFEKNASHSGFFNHSYFDCFSQKYQSYLFSSCENFGTHLWLPCIDRSALALAPSRWVFMIACDTPYRAFAPGQLIREATNSDGSRTSFLFDYSGFNLSPGKVSIVLASLRALPQSVYCTEQAYLYGLTSCLEGSLVSEIKEKVQALLPLDKKLPQVSILFLPDLSGHFLTPSKSWSKGYLAAGVVLIDESVLFRSDATTGRHKLYFSLAEALSSQVFGVLIQEQQYKDMWLLCGIRQQLGFMEMERRCGLLYSRYKIYKLSEKFQSLAARGEDTYPLERLSCFEKDAQILRGQAVHDEPGVYISSCGPTDGPHHALIYLKSGLLMHSISKTVGFVHFTAILKEIVKGGLNGEREYSFSKFMEIYKKESGLNLKGFQGNWINTTGCPIFELKHQFSKKHNQVTFWLRQESNLVNYLKAREKLDHTVKEVEYERGAKRWFLGKVKLLVYESNGLDIRTEQFQMELAPESSTVQQLFPVRYKFRKFIAKKKDFQTEETKRMQLPLGAVSSTGKDKKLYRTEIEQRLFQDKEIISPILWIRIDPEHQFLRKVIVDQPRVNWHIQLLKEPDIIGQYQALKVLSNMPPDQETFIAIKHFCTKKDAFYSIKKMAVKALSKLQASSFSNFLSSSSTLLQLYKDQNFQKRTKLYHERLAKPQHNRDLFHFLTQPYFYFYASKVRDMALPGQRLFKMTDNIVGKTMISIHRSLSGIATPFDVYQLRHIVKTIRSLGYIDNVYLASQVIGDLFQVFKEQTNKRPKGYKHRRLRAVFEAFQNLIHRLYRVKRIVDSHSDNIALAAIDSIDSAIKLLESRMRTIRGTLHSEIYKMDSICQLSSLKMIVGFIMESAQDPSQAFLEMFANLASFFQKKEITLTKLYLEAMRQVLSKRKINFAKFPKESIEFAQIFFKPESYKVVDNIWAIIKNKEARRDRALVGTASSIFYLLFGLRIPPIYSSQKFRHQFVLTLDKTWLLEEADHYKYSDATQNEGIGLSRKVLHESRPLASQDASQLLNESELDSVDEEPGSNLFKFNLAQLEPVGQQANFTEREANDARQIMELIEKVFEEGHSSALDKIHSNYSKTGYKVMPGENAYEAFKRDIIYWLDELNTDENEMEDVLSRAIMVKFGHLEADEELGSELSGSSEEGGY